MDYVLHSEHDKVSREFVVNNDLQEYSIVNWVNDSEAQAYLNRQLPSPSEFPAVVFLLPAVNDFPKTAIIVTNPVNLEGAQSERDSVLAIKTNFVEDPEDPDNKPFVGYEYNCNCTEEEINAFYLAIQTAPLWTQVPALRPARPQLVLTQDSLIKNFQEPTRIQTIWEDIKIGLLASSIGEEGATAIITMVEALAVEHNIPLIAQ